MIQYNICCLNFTGSWSDKLKQAIRALYHHYGIVNMDTYIVTNPEKDQSQAGDDYDQDNAGDGKGQPEDGKVGDDQGQAKDDSTGNDQGQAENDKVQDEKTGDD